MRSEIRLIQVSTIMSENNIPKGAYFSRVQLPVKTKSNNPDEKAGYGLLGVFVKINGEPYDKPFAKAVHSFLLNRKIIDKNWKVIPWGDGWAVAPLTSRSKTK